MLTLVADVVLLEAEEESEPIEEVHVRKPLRVRRPTEVADGAEGGGGGSDLGEAEGRVVCEEVVDGDYVVGLLFFFGPAALSRPPSRVGSVSEIAHDDNDDSICVLGFLKKEKKRLLLVFLK